jgi:hypothetical protein
VPLAVHIPDAGTLPTTLESLPLSGMKESLASLVGVQASAMSLLEPSHTDHHRREVIRLDDRQSSDAAVVEPPNLSVAVGARDGLDVLAQAFASDAYVLSDLGDGPARPAKLFQSLFELGVIGEALAALCGAWLKGAVTARLLTGQTTGKAAFYAAAIGFSVISSPGQLPNL